MKVQYTYNPRMFEIMGEQPAPLSKRALGKLLLSYIHRTGAHIDKNNTTYIQMNSNLQELSGIDYEHIYLFIDGIKVVYPDGDDALEDFVTNVYRKWVMEAPTPSC